jgi:hypothetical protein
MVINKIYLRFFCGKFSHHGDKMSDLYKGFEKIPQVTIFQEEKKVWIHYI